MSDIEDVLDRHRIQERRYPHPTLPGVFVNKSACTGCDWTGALRHLGGDREHQSHLAALISAAHHLDAVDEQAISRLARDLSRLVWDNDDWLGLEDDDKALWLDIAERLIADGWRHV